MNRKILILLLTFFSLQTKAIYIDGIFYSVSTNGASVICPPYDGYNYDYFTESGVISIPDSIDNNGTTYPVIAIDYRAFYKCSGLISISLPNTLIAIGSEAFYGCKKITSITIPYPVTTIGSNAFDYCENLLDVTCLAITPPKMGDYRCLYPAYYMATLHVPERSEEAPTSSTAAATPSWKTRPSRSKTAPSPTSTPAAGCPPPRRASATSAR